MYDPRVNSSNRGRVGTKFDHIIQLSCMNQEHHTGMYQAKASVRAWWISYLVATYNPQLCHPVNWSVVVQVPLPINLFGKAEFRFKIEFFNVKCFSKGVEIQPSTQKNLNFVWSVYRSICFDMCTFYTVVYCYFSLLWKLVTEEQKMKQAGAELCQAKDKLGLLGL